jgi:hypothetical protein
MDGNRVETSIFLVGMPHVPGLTLLNVLLGVAIELLLAAR